MDDPMASGLKLQEWEAIEGYNSTGNYHFQLSGGCK
jgi:hypothetical protein